jgi:hypothetical protein
MHLCSNLSWSTSTFHLKASPASFLTLSNPISIINLSFGITQQQENLRWQVVERERE